MKISYNWLKNYINIDLAPEKVSQILTSIGLEVESVETYEEIKGNLNGFVIGEVLTCSKHPNADKLSITTVNIGQARVLSIVCGAPNVAAGQKVVVATIGAELFMGKESFTIKKTKIRGEESEGMICAEDEIGLGTSHEGIMVLDPLAIPGTRAADYFKIENDTVFEIGLTPNRIDAASHYGVARDLAAFLSMETKVILKKPDISGFKTDNSSLHIPVSIEDPLGCRRFTGVTISGVTIATSPKWLQNKLKAIGLSPINNVVDITNYILHELGQPLHAYDADILQDRKVVVRRMAEGTKFITLDGIERSLSDQDVMVCDGKEGACIGGVFGGIKSGVNEFTKNIFLESAYFDPVAVRKTARRHGLNTDASFRFERGVDPANTLFALKRAAMLIKEIAGGKISSEAIDVHPSPIKPLEIDILYSHIDRLIGVKIEPVAIRKILHSLEIEVLSEKVDLLKVKIPSYRVDVTREADVIEEILRIYGYNNVGFSDKINASMSYVQKPDNERLVNIVSDYLADCGFTEIMSNSLTKSGYYDGLKSFPPDQLVYMLNPLSADLSVMRQTLLFGGLEAIERNINHKNPNLRLFEYGRVYFKIGKDKTKLSSFSESPSFALFITGNKEEQSWAVKDTPTTFYQLKAYYLNFLQKVGINPEIFKNRDIDGFDDLLTEGIEYLLDGVSVIRAGVVNSILCSKFNIENEVYFAEINWGKLVDFTSDDKKFSELPKYPEVRRDLALLLDEKTKFSEIEKISFDAEGKLLKRINLFDFYKGKNIPEGKKSYAVSFFLQDMGKTLTDKEIERIMLKITESLKKKLNAELR
jgi:phenylalanyl-tRNA synthetase beta chain